MSAAVCRPTVVPAGFGMTVATGRHLSLCTFLSLPTIFSWENIPIGKPTFAHLCVVIC